MNCDLLDGYIGVRGCSETPPESGIYLDDQPGVSLFAASKVAGSKDISGSSLLERVLSQSYLQVISEVVASLGEEGYILREDRIISRNDASRLSALLTAGDEFKMKIYPLSSYHSNIVDRIEVFAQGDGNLTWTLTANGTEIRTGTEGVVGGQMTTIEIQESFLDEVELTITADVDLNYYSGVSCSCLRGSRTPGRLWIVSNFDLCLMAYNYRRMLLRGFLMAATMAYMTESKVSERVNVTQRGSEEVANTILLELRGGVDPATGFRVTGNYPKFVKTATAALINEILEGRIPGFDCEGIRAIYTHP